MSSPWAISKLLKPRKNTSASRNGTLMLRILLTSTHIHLSSGSLNSLAWVQDPELLCQVLRGPPPQTPDISTLSYASDIPQHGMLVISEASVLHTAELLASTCRDPGLNLEFLGA